MKTQTIIVGGVCIAVALCCGTIYKAAHHGAVDGPSSILEQSDVILSAQVLSMQRIDPKRAYLHLGSVCIYKGAMNQNDTLIPADVGAWGLPGVATGWPTFSTNVPCLLFFAKPRWYSRFYYLMKVAEDNDSWRRYLRSRRADIK
jgi:hypothetical protein